MYHAVYSDVGYHAGSYYLDFCVRWETVKNGKAGRHGLVYG